MCSVLSRTAFKSRPHLPENRGEAFEDNSCIMRRTWAEGVGEEGAEEGVRHSAGENKTGGW
jgi:hypothetical protein